MTTTVGYFLVERLSQWGVTRIFGYPGDGINGVFGALARANGKIEFVQARHEEMAAFMASAPSQVRHLLDRAVRTAVGERPPGQEVTPVGAAAGCDLFNGKAKNRCCGQRVVATPNPPWASQAKALSSRERSPDEQNRQRPRPAYQP